MDITSNELLYALYEVLPSDGTKVPNHRARAMLARSLGSHVSSEDYEQARNALRDSGLVTIGRGRGGSIHRLVKPEKTNQVIPESISRELELYPPTVEYVDKMFCEDVGIKADDYLVEMTAHSGPATGKFTRPDVTLITTLRHKFTGSQSLNIYSFEVKTEKGGDADAVLEAASHHQQTHYAYVVWHLPRDSAKSARQARVEDYAKHFGVGLILIRKIEGRRERRRITEVEITVHSSRHEPSLEKVDKFIEDRIGMPGKDRILSWLKV